MKLRRITALLLSLITAVTATVLPSGTVFAEGESPWTETTEGTYTYTHGDNTADVPEALDLKALKPSETAWSDIYYVSVEVTADNDTTPAVTAEFGGNYKEVTGEGISAGDTVTVYFETSKAEPDYLNLVFWHVDYDNGFGIEAGTNITVSNITFSTEERDYSSIKNEWYSPAENTWCYRNDDTAVKEIPGLDLMQFVPDTINWADVKYISADIETEGKAQPVIDINFTGNEEDWKSGTPKIFEDDKVTVYYNTKGEEPVWSSLSFWCYDENEIALSENQLVTVTGITFSTEERDYSNLTGEWYSPAENTWCYRNDDTDVTEIPGLPIDTNGIDWGTAKYISANVSIDKDTIAVLGGDSNGWIDGTPIYINNDTQPVFLYTEGMEFVDVNIGFWPVHEKEYAVPANALITVTDITVSDSYLSETECRNVKGQWVKTGAGQYYYNHEGRSDTAYVEGPVLNCPYDIADVQTISITARTLMTGGTPKGVKLTVAGNTADGGWHPGYNFAFGATEKTVERKYRGCITDRPSLDISFGEEDLAVIAAGGSIEIYVSDIQYSVDPINIIYSTPNDLLIDDNETEIVGDNEHDIMYNGIVNMETTGTLKIYTEHLSGFNTHEIRAGFREWSDFDNITILYASNAPVAIGDGEVYEIRITEEILDIIHKKAPLKSELALMGTGYRFLKATFTPDPDAPAPVPEEIKPEAVPQKDKTELEQSKNNTITEFDAPSDIEDFDYDKAQGHKSERKKNKKGESVYALRIVERVKKDTLKHAESVTITVYSKKAGQYITLKADTCFSFLNINGVKVKAGGKDAFLTVVLDNIPADDEITFTNFTINYKK